MSVLWEEDDDGRRVAVEGAFSDAGGWSGGAVLALAARPWRLESSVTQSRHAGFPRRDFRAQVRVSLPGGRARAAFGVRQDEDDVLSTQRHGELEVQWNAQRGWRLTGLWRRRAQWDLSPASDLERVVRYTLEWGRKPWSLTARVDDRAAAAGSSFLAEFRAGRAWSAGRVEIRARERTAEGQDPGVYGYRRRPGGLFDLERLPLGPQWGAWAEIRLKTLKVEFSADAGETGWETAAALQFSLQGID